MNATQFFKYAATFAGGAAGGAYAQHKLTQQQVYRDPAFLAILDVALQDVSESDIAQLVNLSPNRLRDWAMAPKALRPALLTKWASEPEVSSLENLANTLGHAADDIDAFRAERAAARKKKWRFRWFALAALWLGVLVIIFAFPHS